MAGNINLPVVGGSKKLWISRGVVVGALVVGLCGVLPIVWSALLAGLGLIGIGIVGVLGVGIVRLLPLLGQVLENRILKLRKFEARTNPLEQLENELIRRDGQITAFKNALKAASGKIKGLKEMIETRQKEAPGHDLSQPKESLEMLKQYHAAQVQKLDKAQKALDDFRFRVECKKSDLELAKVGKDAMAAMNVVEGGDITQRLLTDEAFKSIADDFNQVFGDLELDAALSQAAKMGFTGETTPELIEGRAPDQNQQ